MNALGWAIEHCIPIICGAFFVSALGALVLLAAAEDVDVDLGDDGGDLPAVLGRTR